MAERTDITVNYDLSPRIITVSASSNEVALQDLVDTLRVDESQISSLDDDSLLEAAGKESLGGGIQVGITVELQNAQLEFEPRTTPLESGSISVSGVTTLSSSDATFVTNAVGRGDLVVNFTDRSTATVLSVVSETELTTTSLKGGVENDYDVDDDYAVYDLEQCNVAGGNLVSVDSSGTGSLDPIFPSFGTHIVRTSSSSATLLNQESLEFSSFAGAVALDPVSGSSGTDFPKGTLQEPINNLADALTVANERGLKTLTILSDITIATGENISGFVVKGLGSRNGLTVNVESDASVDDTKFLDVTLTGTLNDRCHIEGCVVENVSLVGEFIIQSTLSGTLSLSGSRDIFIKNCIDRDPSQETPTVDMLNYTGDLNIREYYGGITLKNKTTDNTVALDFATGRAVVDSTVVSGTIRLRGIGTVESSAAEAVVINTGSLMSNIAVADYVWDEIIAPDHTGSDSAGELLFGAGGGSSPSQVADAVWDELVSDHLTAGSFGKVVKTIATLTKFLAFGKKS